MPRVKPTKPRTRAKTGEKRAGPGRPPIELTTEQLAQLTTLARIRCTHEEIAAVLGISTDTLTRHFAEHIKKGHLEGYATLRRSQFKAATEGNVTMQIWLGKVLLGQAETVSVPADGKGKTRAPQYFRIGGQLLEI